MSACLCAIANRVEFVNGQGVLLGMTNALAMNGATDLNLTPEAERRSVILVKTRLPTLEDGAVDY